MITLYFTTVLFTYIVLYHFGMQVMWPIVSCFIIAWLVNWWKETT